MMRKTKVLIALLGATVVFLALSPARAFAHGKDGHKNLKVLADTDHKAFDAGMKSLSKALGVKCTACHVKGKFDKDDVPAKEAARSFMSAAIGESDAGKREAALKELLAAMKLEKAKDEALLWKTVAGWQKKDAAKTHEHGAHDGQ